MQTQAPVITIDGPSGVGKGTISQLLAEELKWHLLDSGALYRVLALAAQHHGVGLDNEAALEVLASHLDVQFQTGTAGKPARVILESDDVTDIIRTEKQGNAASQVAVMPGARRGLLERQKAFQQMPGLVAEGRDMGTIVFPEADLKIFLVASAEERAQRRYQQLKDKGINVKLADLVEQIAERDTRDSSRSIAPLVAAEDALVIDTTNLGIKDVLSRVLMEVKRSSLLSV